MCSQHHTKFCLICLYISLLSWLPIHTSDDIMTTGTYPNINRTEENGGHKHYHDHDYHELIPEDGSTGTSGNVRRQHEEYYFAEQLSVRYGENKVLTIEGLEKMLNKIGSKGKDVNKDHDHEEETHSGWKVFDQKHLGDQDENNNTHIMNHNDSAVHAHHELHADGKDSICNSTINDIMKMANSHDDLHKYYSKCIKDVRTMMILYHYNPDSPLTMKDLISLSPGLLLLLDNKHISSDVTDEEDHSHGDNSSHDDHHHDEDHSHGDNGNHDDPHHDHTIGSVGYSSVIDIPAQVWGYSCVSVLIISLVGLTAVVLIPIMQKVFYNHLLQFLVGLAVGALAGDALLHLLPHAFGGDSHSSHGSDDKGGHSEDNTSVYKGLCALLGIFLFFFMERLLTIFTNFKRKEKKKSRCSKQMEMHDESHHHVTSLHSPSVEEPDCETHMLGIHPGKKALENFAKESHHGNCELLNGSTDAENHNIRDVFHSDIEEDNTVLSFSHGHSHHACKKLPKTVASIAWMVILGDGIHNFSDGVAIGAAFADSVTGGISTSIAIFCHELPHEIGDFAVLLQAGMTWKQALIYNLVSSVLAFLGMLIGVMIGNMGSASLWVFSVVGGIFLYIALVDMLPEMTALVTRKGENLFCHLFLQSCGMLLGAGIMFTVAIFEHDLMNVLEI